MAATGKEQPEVIVQAVALLADVKYMPQRFEAL